MPEISRRGIQMPASPIRKLAPLSDAAKARGGVKVYHLNIGQPDLPSPVSALDAIREIDRTTLEYSPSDGYRFYRENLVTYYKKFDIDLLPEEIIVTAGGSEAVLYAFMACLNPGDEIIVPPNRPMPTIWLLPSLPVQLSAQFPLLWKLGLPFLPYLSSRS